MGKRAIFLVAAAVAALVVGGGAALADSITCTTNPCLGTPNDDTISGTNSAEELRGLGGRDTILSGGEDDLVRGGDKGDRLYGDTGFDRSLDGDDVVRGGRGKDDMNGAGRSDTFAGGRGDDSIDARDNLFAGDPPIPGTDTVGGGGGNDSIQAGDGAVDVIDCGAGNKDSVYRDLALDTTHHCEKKSGF